MLSFNLSLGTLMQVSVVLEQKAVTLSSLFFYKPKKWDRNALTMELYRSVGVFIP